jgi:hypothetical protein
LLLFVIFQYIFYLGCEGVEAEALKRLVSRKTDIGEVRTLRALMICSGAIVFLDSCSQISFASDEIRCMNSCGHKSGKGLDRKSRHASPTQHSMTRSLVSFAHTMSLGSSSGGGQVRRKKRKEKEKDETCDHLRDCSLWEREVVVPGGAGVALAV